MPTDFSITEFTPKEAKVYLKALLIVANADGDISDKEKRFLQSQASLLGVEISDYLPFDSQDLFFIHDNDFLEIHKKVLLRDSIILANIDDSYDEQEKLRIRQIADQLNMDHHVVDLLEDWYQQSINFL